MLRPTLESPSGIYLIINHVNGNVYVGSSRRLASRWSAHRRGLETNKHDGPGLQAAYNKYGAESFTFEVVEYCTPEVLFEREQHYIDTLKPRYNRNPIAGKPPENDGSEERRRQTSAQFKGRKHTEQTKQRMSEAAMGRKKSPEHVANIRIAAAIRGEKRRGSKDSDEVRAKKKAAQQKRLEADPRMSFLDEARKKRAVLTLEQAVVVRELVNSGATQSYVAKMFGVGYWVIGAIMRDRSSAYRVDQS